MFLQMKCERRLLKISSTLWLVTFLFFSITSLAQRRRDDDTSHYRTEPVPTHLLPIERAAGSSSLGGVYYYGGKKLSSPYSLEIPFYELNDPDVSHHFQAFRTLTTLSRLTALVPLAYIILQSNKSYNSGAYWTVYGSSVAASITLYIIGSSQVSKAVARYNGMLRQPRIGMTVAPVPLTGQVAVGAGVTWPF